MLLHPDLRSILSGIALGVCLLTIDSHGATLTDIAYSQDARDSYQRERCKLDLHLPENAEGFATVVWFHGGSLQNGDKGGDIAVGIAERLNRNGIAVASVNYRLSPQATFPAYIEDSAAAVAWVLQNIERHGGAKDSVFVSGHSAGGYLAAMVAMDPAFLTEHSLSPMDLAGVIPVAGQMVTHSTVREEQGIPRTTPVVDAAAPVHHVRAVTPPFLNIAADADLPARLEENTYFVAAMKAAGNGRVSFMTISDRDHGSVASRIAEEDDPVLVAMLEFISAHGD